MVLLSVLTLVSLLAPGAFSTSAVFTGSAVFERLSHFKDVGVPAVVQSKDLLNQAMIADGSCRAALAPAEFDGYAFFKDRARVQRVIEAVEKLPSTRGPSRFVLAAQSQLEGACNGNIARGDFSDDAYSCQSGYLFSHLKTSMHNWHRALCAPANDSSWGGMGMYDPAYQPQQEALTIGFMCMLACDCNHMSLPAASLSAIAGSLAAPDASRAILCDAVPWGKVNFTKSATDPNALAALATPLMDQVCKCQH